MASATCASNIRVAILAIYIILIFDLISQPWTELSASTAPVLNLLEAFLYSE